MPKINIKVYYNKDNTTIFINKRLFIENCYGLAIHRKRFDENNLLVRLLTNNASFSGDANVEGKMLLSTEWSIQKYIKKNSTSETFDSLLLKFSSGYFQVFSDREGAIP